MAVQMPIRVSNLALDPVNPRLDATRNQREEIRAFATQGGEKMVKLAADIVKHGLNPAESPIVMPDAEDEGRYYVLEGNRRVAALKILSSPELIDDAVNAAMQKSYHGLADLFAKAPILEVTCTVVANREEADHWIELKHTGENGGVGVLPWNATEVDRHLRARKQKPAPVLELYEWVRDNGKFSAAVEQRLIEKAFPITNLERLLSDEKVRSRIGLVREKSGFHRNVDEKALLKVMVRIVSDLVTGTKVSHIDNAKLRAKYMRGLTDEIPAAKSRLSDAVPITSAASTAGKAKTATKKRVQTTAQRKVLIPATCVLTIKKPARLNNIYDELMRLEVEKHRNAVGILLRVFIELSVDDFLKRKKISLVDKKGFQLSLGAKMILAAAQIEDAGAMTAGELKNIRRMAGGPPGKIIGATETLNGYVHDNHAAPLSMDLKVTWDNIQPFIEVLLG